MIELWTEDSTSGYRFLKKINKVVYSNQLKVVPHNGIGETLPTSTAIYGGVLYHLKHVTRNNLILLYIDKAIDIQGTAENYADIIREARRHKNVKIIEQICFELGLLSYVRLFDIAGNRNADLKRVTDDFVGFSKNLSTFRPPYFSNLLKAYILKKCGKKMQYEHVSKILLSDITSVATMYGNKQNNLAIISGRKVGPCWVKDCCVIPCAFNTNKKCLIPIMSIEQKINDIVTNSFIQDSVKQINNFIHEYIDMTYKKSSDNDSFYMEQYYKKYGDKIFIKHVAEYMDTNMYWNYERLYKRY